MPIFIKSALPACHFYVISLSFFFQALTLGQVYRFFAYVNLLIVLIFALSYFKPTALKPVLHKMPALVFGSLMLLIWLFVTEWGVTAHFPYDIKEIRHVILAIGLMLGIAVIALNHDCQQTKIKPTLLAMVYLYTLSQLVAIYLLDRPYGTTKNPHYLAIYSAIFLVVSTFLALKTQHYINRILLVACSIILGALLVYTSSRPTWIGLILAVMLVILCLRRKSALILAALSCLLFAVLLLVNAENFKSRWEDLLLHLGTEERVTIWQDTWQMQKSSNALQWAFGHGVEAFQRDFPKHSRYYAQEKIDFNSPHNVVLELLYLYGVTGLLLVLAGLGWLYKAVLSIYFKTRENFTNGWIYLLLLMVLTIDVFTVGITLPFFVSINLNIIALVMGVTTYLNKLRNQ